MSTTSLPLQCIALSVAMLSQPALAQGDGGEANGAAAASVVAPSRVTHIADLRFGAFASPSSASTLRVGVDGSVTPTGDVAFGMNVDQPPGGRGPAQFKIEQSKSHVFLVLYPSEVEIISNSASMMVNNTTIRLVRTRQRGINSEWRLDMGGTLNIDANQQTGSYSGDFTVTVVYF